MRILNIPDTMSYIETAMNEKKDKFDEDDFKQLDKTKIAGNLSWENRKTKNILQAESTSLIEEKGKFSLKVYKLARKIATNLDISEHKDNKYLYFKFGSPSKMKKSFNKSINFLKNCFYMLNAKGDKCEILSFKAEIEEINIEASKYSENTTEHSSSKLNFGTERDELYLNWYEELKILELKIKIKARIYKFDVKNVYKEIPLTKPKAKPNKDKPKSKTKKDKKVEVITENKEG